MKCQILFSGEKYDKYFSMSSAEILPRMLSLRRMDSPVSFSTILYKGDNFCDFQSPSHHIKTLLKRGLLKKESMGANAYLFE